MHGSVLNVGARSIDFTARRTMLGTAFRRVGHDAMRGAGKRIVPVILVRATVSTAGAPRELFRVRCGGPSTWMTPMPLHKRVTIPVGWVQTLEAVAAEHRDIREDEAEAAAAALSGDPELALQSSLSRRSSRGLGADHPADDPVDGKAAVDAELGKATPAASAAAMPSESSEPPVPPGGSTGADAETAIPGDDMVEPSMSDLESPVAAQVWSSLVSADESDEASAERIMSIVFGVLGGSKTALLGRPHPIEGETEAEVPANRRGESLIHAAASTGKVGSARLILNLAEGLVNPNARCTGGSRSTPLHLAVAGGHATMVSFLLAPEGGARESCHTRDASGRTPLALAVSGANAAVREAFESAGIVLEGQLLDGNNPAHLACTSGDVERVEEALTKASDEELVATNDAGQTPLDVAVSQLIGRSLARALGLFARRIPEQVRKLAGEGQPLLHGMIPVIAGSLTAGRWDLTTCKSSGAMPFVTADGLGVRFLSNKVVIALSTGVSQGSKLTFRVVIEKEKAGDETCAIGFVRNAPHSTAYSDTDDHFFYRPYNGDFTHNSGDGTKTTATLGKAHMGEEVELTFDATGATGELYVQTPGTKTPTRVLTGVGLNPGDKFFPALSCYTDRKAEIRLLGVSGATGSFSPAMAGGDMDMARVAESVAAMGPDDRLTPREVAQLGGPVARHLVESIQEPDATLHVGSLVRVRPGTEPKTGWGSASAFSVGPITELRDGGTRCTVNFPEHKGWRGVTAELVLVDVHGRPVESAGPLSRSLSGAASAGGVGFQEGSRVRVKPGLKPSTGWGSATSKSIGVITEFKDDRARCKVDFPEHKGWNGIVAELDLVDASGQSVFAAAASAYGIRIGTRVQVKPGHSPKLGWGSVTASSVGPVASLLENGRCTVDFPEQKGWQGLLLELVPVGGVATSIGLAASLREGKKDNSLPETAAAAPVAEAEFDPSDDVPLESVMSAESSAGEGILSTLLAVGGSLDEKDSSGRTLLHVLAAHGHLGAAETRELLRAGVDPMARDVDGRVAIRHCTRDLGESLQQLHSLRIEGVAPVTREEETSIRGSFTATRYRPAPATAGGSDSDSDGADAATDMTTLGPNRWLDQVAVLTSGDESKAVRFAAWDVPKAGDVLKRGTVMVPGPDWPSDEPFTFGSLRSDLVVSGSSVGSFKFPSGVKKTLELSTTRLCLRPATFDPFVNDEGKARWNKSMTVLDLDLRYRERATVTDVGLFAPGMFVVRGPTWSAGDEDGHGSGWVTGVTAPAPGCSDPGSVVVTWQSGASDRAYRIGGPEGFSDVVVIDVDPTSDACMFLLSGAGISVDDLKLYADCQTLCYSPTGHARITAVREAREAAQAAEAAVSEAGGFVLSTEAGDPAAGASASASSSAEVADPYGPKRMVSELVFDLALLPDLGSGKLALDDEDRAVKSVKGNGTALVRTPLRGGSVHRVVFTVVKETESGQCTCFGVGLPGAASHSYAAEAGSWLYRSFNGHLYGTGKVGKSKHVKIVKGDEVAMTVDLRPGAGTLAYQIGGKDVGVCFMGLPTSPETVLLPAVCFYGNGRTVRVESATELARIEEDATLELRASALAGDSSCASCNLPFACHDAWLDMERWARIEARFVRQRLDVVKAARRCARLRSPMAICSSLAGTVPRLGMVVVGIDPATLLVTMQDETLAGRPEDVDPYQVVEVATERRLSVVPRLALKPKEHTTLALCPTCFASKSKGVRAVLMAADNGIAEIARASAAALLPAGSEAHDEEAAARALLRAVLGSTVKDGSSLLRDCVLQGRLAWVHAAVEAAGMRDEILQSEPCLVSLAAARVPAPEGGQDGADDFTPGDDDETDDDEGEFGGAVKRFRAQLARITPAVALQRIVSLGQLGAPAPTHKGAPWLSDIRMPLETSTLHALVVLPDARAPDSSAGTLAAWVALPVLVAARFGAGFRTAKKSSSSSEEAGDNLDIVPSEQWQRAGGRDFVDLPAGPAMSTAAFLMELAAGRASAVPGASESFRRAASRLLRVSVLSQLSGRIEQLNARGARLEDSSDELGRSPLHVVCSAPAPPVELVERLLALGASAVATDASGATPIHYASRCSSGSVAADVLMALLCSLRPKGGSSAAASSSADELDTDEDGMLLPAGKEGKDAVLAAVNAHDGSGRRPLHLAVRAGGWDSAELLLDCGADLVHKDDDEPPLHTAVRAGQRHMVRLLLSRDSDVNSCNRRTGNTALHLSVARRSRALVALLLDNDAVPDRANSDELTPMAMARRLEVHDVLGLLHEAVEQRALAGKSAEATGAAAAMASMVGSQLIDPADVTLGRVLGEGGFGVVMEAELSHRPGTKVVVKQLKTVTKLDGAHREMLVQEVQAMRLACSMHHPAVLQFIGLVAQDDGESANGKPLAYGLVLEHAAGGSLRSMLDREDAPTSLPLLRRLALLADVASGLAFLHKALKSKPPIAHRDLKPDNILLNEEHTSAIISDFGLSKVRSVAEQGSKTSKFSTTMHYRAPEAWLTKKHQKQQAAARRAEAAMAPSSPEVDAGPGISLRDRRIVAQDVFSLGVMIWETVTLLPPFGGDFSIVDVHEDIVINHLPPGPVFFAEEDADPVSGAGSNGQEDNDSEDEEGVATSDNADLDWFENWAIAHSHQSGAQATLQQTSIPHGTSATSGGVPEIGDDLDGMLDDDGVAYMEPYDALFSDFDRAAAAAMPRSLARLIAACCEPDPDDRPASEDVAAELRRIHGSISKQQKRRQRELEGAGGMADKLQEEQEASPAPSAAAAASASAAGGYDLLSEEVAAAPSRWGRVRK